MVNFKWKNNILFGVCLIFFLILSTPLAFTLFDYINKILEGKVEKILPFDLSVESYFDGKLQENIDEWWGNNFRFRNELSKSANQIDISLFKLISNFNFAFLNTNHGEIFLKKDVQEYVRRVPTDFDLLESEVKAISRLQYLLEKRGIAFLYIIPASKSFVYPEYLFKKDRDLMKTFSAGDYMNLITLFNKYKVNFLDANELFAEIKTSESTLLFETDGFHWNNYGACIIQKKIYEIIDLQLNKSIIRINCDPPLFLTKEDISEINNRHFLIWKFPYADGFGATPTFFLEKDLTATVPSMAIIGDSFYVRNFALTNKYGISENNNFYNNFLYKVNGPDYLNITSEEVDWRKDFLSKDAIVLEMSLSIHQLPESYVHVFVKMLIAELEMQLIVR